MSRPPLAIFNEPSRGRAMALIAALDLSKAWEVIVRPKKAKRSLDQNSLYWMWLGIIANDTGNTANDVHEWCKCEFLPPVFVAINGKQQECRRSTTELNTADMTAYLDRVSAWSAMELGIALPHPDDQGREVA